MPSRAAYNGIWLIMIIQTSHANTTEMITPALTMMEPPWPKHCSMITDIEGLGIRATWPEEYTPSGSSETRM